MDPHATDTQNVSMHLPFLLFQLFRNKPLVPVSASERMSVMVDVKRTIRVKCGHASGELLGL